MKCDRPNMQKFWTALGKRVAAKGSSLEEELGRLRDDALFAKRCVREGYEAQMRKQARKLLTTNVRDL